MRPMSFLGISAILAFVTLGSPARADDNYDVNVAKGAVTVTAHSGWHINKDYSWAVKKGSDKVKSKEDFNLAQSTATVSGVPKGTYTLKGAVCSESNCAPFTKEITIN
jgi:hypothetical protein